MNQESATEVMKSKLFGRCGIAEFSSFQMITAKSEMEQQATIMAN